MVKKTEISERSANVQAALALLHKKYGDESAMTFDEVSIKKVETISTGSLKLDKILYGGVPRGRVFLAWGAPSAGKSTFSLHVCANAQKSDDKRAIAYVDMEHAFDPIYAEALGCNMKELILLQPNSGNEAVNQCYELAASGVVQLIVLDSIAACVTEAEMNGEIGDMNIGRQARMFSDFFKKVTPALEKNSCALLCTNQERKAPGAYGDASVLPSGESQKYYASIIARFRRQASQKEVDKEGDAVANQISVTTEKNKLGPPFRKAELMIYYGKGFSADNEMFDMAVEFNIVEKAGGWFKYNGENIGQGSVKAKQWIEDHPDVKEYIMNKVKEILMKPIDAKAKEPEEKASEEEGLETVNNEDGSSYKVNPETGEVFD